MNSYITNITKNIKKLLEITGPVKVMEVCGTHTVEISRTGIRELFGNQLDLVSGPGCPVCVTPNDYIAKALWLAKSGVTICTFGDMIQVPVNNESLQSEKAKGYDVQLTYSPTESVEFAIDNPDKKVVFLGVGFETTAPSIAGAIIEAKKKELDNFSVLCTLKTIPAPLGVIASSPNLKIQGFMLPGHVSVIIGVKPYRFLADKYKIPAVIAGFEAVDILKAIETILNMIISGSASIVNEYKRVVLKNGNRSALQLINDVFTSCPSSWRGLGILPNSGLRISGKYSHFDAEKRFNIPDFTDIEDDPMCKCDKVIMGIIKPYECELFKRVCTPQNPKGPCMISSEGSCAAYYKYGY